MDGKDEKNISTRRVKSKEKRSHGLTGGYRGPKVSSEKVN